MKTFTVAEIAAAEVLDSRGTPTIACKVLLKDGSVGFMQVPSGASTGQYEATELRDADMSRYFGKGVLQAVWNIESYLNAYIKDQTFSSIDAFDRRICELDATEQKSRLGANALLGLSGAFARAAARSCDRPLYAFLSNDAHELPIPFMNVINGGRHADNQLAIQEFMLVPHGFNAFSDAVRAGAEITHYLNEILVAQYGRAGRGDEGGFAPDMHDARQALDAITQAIDKSAYTTQQVGIALDLAASEYHSCQGYFIDKSEKNILDPVQWIEYVSMLVNDYPVLSLEDVAADNDEQTWKSITRQLNKQVQIVGDDIFVTQEKRLSSGIQDGIANAILLKPNQVGSISETIATTSLAQKNGYGTIVSHRSGETEDAIIADIAVGLACRQIKTGPLRQSDRLAKYNRLLWIEKELGHAATFPNDYYLNRRALKQKVAEQG